MSRHFLSTIPAICAIFLAAVAHSADSTPDTFPNADRYQLQIDETSAEFGPFDPQLVELFAARGRALQSQGDHNGAIVSLRRALQINRVNQGLYSFQQEGIIRGMVDSLTLLGNYEQVRHFHQQLTQLHDWHLNNKPSKELAPMLLDSSTWHRDLYLELSSTLTVPHLRKSIRLAKAAHTILNNHYHPHHESLIEPLLHMAESSYYLTGYYQHEARYFGSKGESMHGYLVAETFQQGVNSYQRIIDIHKHNQASPQTLAQAQIALGDYLQLFRKHDDSHNAYISAWNTLNEAGDHDSIQRLLGKPVKLPNFDSNSTLGARSVARVKADIGPTGRVRNVEVLETWPADNQLVVQYAQRAALRAVFRNRIVEGKVASGQVEFNLLLP